MADKIKSASAPEPINIYYILIEMEKYTALCLYKSQHISIKRTEISIFYMDVHDIFLLTENTITGKFYI